jgi:hypothetical protein
VVIWPDVLGGRRVPLAGRVVLLVGSGKLGSGGVQGLEPVPGGDDVGGPGPAGWDLQDPSAGVGDQAGRGAEQPEPQGFRFGFGELPVQREVTQSPVQ